MGSVVSFDGGFEWDEDKNILNKENHGFYFEEILAAFADPFFLEAYDRENSTLDEVRWKGSETKFPQPPLIGVSTSSYPTPSGRTEREYYPPG